MFARTIRVWLIPLAAFGIGVSACGRAEAQHGPYDPPVPGLAEYGDWTVACDNTNACTAVSLSRALVREMEQFEGGALAEMKLWLFRSAGPDAAPRVIVDTRVWGLEPVGQFDPANPDGDLPATLHVYYPCDVDCTGPAYRLVRVEPGRYLMAAEDVPAFLAESVRSQALATRQINGALHSIVSSEGLVDVLRHIDREQFRSGTRTALIDRGPEPASTVLPAPALPEVMVVRAAQLEDQARNAEPGLAAAYAEHCDGTAHDAQLPVSHYRLDDGRDLWGMLCGSGPFDAETLWLVSDARGRPQALALPRPDLGEEPQQPILPNSHYDPATGLLVAYSGGLCGWQRSWGWTGEGFAMVEALEMPSCGDLLPDDWLHTWRVIAR